jgi:hypothetical protein
MKQIVSRRAALYVVAAGAGTFAPGLSSASSNETSPGGTSMENKILTSSYKIPTPPLVLVTEILAQVAPPIEMGDGPTGARRIIPIIGGNASGPRLNGKILPGGADFQLIRHDNLTEIQAQYMIETPTGARIYIENTGLRHASPENMDRLKRGETVDPALVYFRSTPRFETASADFAWMERSIFVCSGARFPDFVQFSVFQVT